MGELSGSFTFQVRDVREEILMASDAAPLRPPVAMARVTVMAPVTVEVMMVTPGAGESWFVAATTAGSLGCSIMTRMTAATCLTH